LIGAKQMADERTFRDGFVEGWRAMMGGSASVPSSAAYGGTKGRTAFQEGIRRAVLKALERQGIKPN
jgi:hypothetical protein